MDKTPKTKQKKNELHGKLTSYAFLTVFLEQEGAETALYLEFTSVLIVRLSRACLRSVCHRHIQIQAVYTSLKSLKVPFPLTPHLFLTGQSQVPFYSFLSSLLISPQISYSSFRNDNCSCCVMPPEALS